MTPFRNYYDQDAVKEAVKLGRHREIVGGLWNEIGKLQFDYLVAHGLKPHHSLVDIGCGALRGGVHFVKYLEPGNYFGIDINQSLLDAGMGEIESAGLKEKLPNSNLHRTDNFDLSGFGMNYDFALAHSVFTHLPFNHIRLCLERLPQWVAKSGVFYATFFECPHDGLTSRVIKHQPGGVKTFAAHNPYHYKFADFIYACHELPWNVSYIGDWGHPRSQNLLCFNATR